MRNGKSKPSPFRKKEGGKKFTIYAYETYYNNLETILGHKPYTEKYNEQDYNRVSNYLDKVYEDYLNNPSVKQVKKESFLDKVKGLFHN